MAYKVVYEYERLRSQRYCDKSFNPGSILYFSVELINSNISGEVIGQKRRRDNLHSERCMITHVTTRAVMYIITLPDDLTPPIVQKKMKIQARRRHRARSHLMM